MSNPGPIRIKTVKQALEFMGLGKPSHPLISVFTHTEDMNTDYGNVAVVSDLYFISLKEDIHGSLIYGRQSYDFEEGSMIFMSPGQLVIPPDNQQIDKNGWSIIFHPDLIIRSGLAKRIEEFSFFGYELNEALHVSEKEKQNLSLLVEQIASELEDNTDQHTHDLVISNLELLLKYCARYYNRQFYTRTLVNADVVTRFSGLIKDYFEKENQLEYGIPTVKFCAEKLCMSPNYLSDLLRKETGKSAQDTIHHFLIGKAKNALLNSNQTISSIAFDLGFEYSQHFSKLFKSKTGMTPKEFRNLH